MRSFLLTIALSLVTAACTATVGAQPILDDPDLVARLDLEVPEDIDWTRTIQDVEIAGSGTEPDSAELALLEGAISDLPEGLIEWAQLDTIYRIADDARLEEGTLAFTRGTNIYLIDKTFAEAGRVQLTEILAHELAHVAQFMALDNDDIESVRSKSGPIDPISSSRLVRDFAAHVGWTDRGLSGLAPDWVLAGPSGTTAYGASAPEEDMAESLAQFVVGRTDRISQSRLQWIAQWTGLTAAAAEDGQAYIPPGSQRLTTNQPLYDEAAVAKLSPRSIDVQSYLMMASSAPAATLAPSIQAELLSRGLAGFMRPIVDDRLPRFGGVFTRGDGQRMWVELWDFRASSSFSSAPDGPVLTYVILS